MTPVDPELAVHAGIGRRVAIILNDPAGTVAKIERGAHTKGDATALVQMLRGAVGDAAMTEGALPRDSLGRLVDLFEYDVILRAAATGVSTGAGPVQDAMFERGKELNKRLWPEGE